VASSLTVSSRDTLIFFSHDERGGGALPLRRLVRAPQAPAQSQQHCPQQGPASQPHAQQQDGFSQQHVS
jgi:hypothetical protein